MEEQRKKINLVVLGTFLLAVLMGVMYYFIGDSGENTVAQGTLIANILGEGMPYVWLIR